MLDKVIKNMIEERLNEVHTCMLCRVISYNENTEKARIKPLQQRKYKDGKAEDYPIIENVPVLKRKVKRKETTTTTVEGTSNLVQETGEDEIYTDTPYIENGDTVLVVFTERARTGEGTRKFDLSDAVILGVI